MALAGGFLRNLRVLDGTALTTDRLEAWHWFCKRMRHYSDVNGRDGKCTPCRPLPHVCRTGPIRLSQCRTLRWCYCPTLGQTTTRPSIELQPMWQPGTRFATVAAVDTKGVSADEDAISTTHLRLATCDTWLGACRGGVRRFWHTVEHDKQQHRHPSSARECDRSILVRLSV